MWRDKRQYDLYHHRKKSDTSLYPFTIVDLIRFDQAYTYTYTNTNTHHSKLTTIYHQFIIILIINVNRKLRLQLLLVQKSCQTATEVVKGTAVVIPYEQVVDRQTVVEPVSLYNDNNDYDYMKL